jgi:hypothetical protein
MRNRNPDSPWNPSESVQVTPEEYELQVLEWLRNSKACFENFNISHREIIEGQSGEFV